MCNMRKKSILLSILLPLFFTFNFSDDITVSVLFRRVRLLQVEINWARFSPLIKKYEQGKITFAENNPISGTLEPFPEGKILRYEELSDASQQAKKLISEGKFGILYLAGGAGTRLGLKNGETKATNAVVAGYTPLEVLCMDISQKESRFGGQIPVLISTSKNADDIVTKILKEKGYYGLNEEQFFRFKDESSGIRFVARPEDAEAALGSQVGGKVTQEEYDEVLKFAHEYGGKTFLELYQKGIISDSQNIYCGTGNDILPSFVINGGLSYAIEKGLDVLMIRNDANFGATIDPKILEAFLNSGCDIMAEMVLKNAGETGGVAAEVDGKPAISEVPQIPLGVDQDIFPDFNTNTIYIKVDAILKIFGFKNREEFLQVSENPEEFVKRVRQKVANFPNIMVIRIRKIEGGNIPVLEFQNILASDLSQAGLKIGFIRVPRDIRYLNVKKKEDLIDLAPQVINVVHSIQ